MDSLSRLVAQQLGERMGQQFIIDNKPGAATRVSMDALVKAPADGYTLAVSGGVAAIFPLMFDDFPFVPGKDFMPVALLGRSPSFLAVRANLPAKNVTEFVTYVRANSGKVTFGHGGTGTNPHLASTRLMQTLGIEATAVAYKGNSPTAVALASGEIDFALLDYVAVRPMLERGAVRLLAVTEAKRASMVPEVPTSGEQGLTREIDGVTPWFMLVAPAGTPVAVVTNLNRHVNEILKSKDVLQRLKLQGIEPDFGSPAEALAHFQGERDKMTRLVQVLKVSLKN